MIISQSFSKRLGILIILTLFNTLSYGQGISVSPSRIFFKGEPGQIVTHAITFSNSSQAELNFISSIKDWNRDSLGVKQYYSVGELPESNGAWLSFTESSVQLAPGETKVVNLSMTIPADKGLNELTQSMVFFTQVKEQSKGNQQQGLAINILLEMGVQVYHVPAGLERGDLEFVAFEDRGIVPLAKDSVRQMAIKIQNTGQINKDAYLRFELTNMETGEEIPIETTAMALLPNAEQWISVNLPATLKGRYLAVAIVDAGSQYDLKVAEKEIQY